MMIKHPSPLAESGVRHIWHDREARPRPIRSQPRKLYLWQRPVMLHHVRNFINTVRNSHTALRQIWHPARRRTSAYHTFIINL